MLRDLFFMAPARVPAGFPSASGNGGGPRPLRLARRPRHGRALALLGAVLALPFGLARAAEPAPAASASPAAAATPTPAAPRTARAGTATGKRYFKAEISWANNTYYTPSNASGHAEFELDIATHKLRWVLTYKDLSSAPTKVTLHAPAQPGATGAAIMDLAPQGLKSPTTGEGQLTDAQVEYLLTGWSYALVTTRKYPQGEARGQLDRVRTATPAFAKAGP